MTEFADSGGVRIAYELLGEGEPVVLIHGLGYDRAGWGPFPQLLAERFQVLVFDNRGVGESDAPEGPYAVSQMVGDTLAAMDAAGFGRAHVFGVSLGGLIAQELALSHLERVERLVLCSTSPGGPKSHPMPAAGLEAFQKYPAMEREAGLRYMVENALGERGVRELPELVEEIWRYRLEHAPTLAAWQAQGWAGATFDAYDRLGAIAAPTLVLHGTPDNVVDTRNGELLAQLIPGARLELVPDRGHLMVWEDPQTVTRLVTEFLAA